MTLRLKQGETIRWYVEDGLGDLTGVTISAKIAQKDFVKELTVTPDDITAGTYILTGPSTADFPVGIYEADIKYVIDGITDLSNTFRVYVDKGITK